MTDVHPDDADRGAARAHDEGRAAPLAELRLERDSLLALVESITDEVWFADVSGKVTLVNPAVWREFGALDGESIEEIAATFEVYRADGTPAGGSLRASLWDW